MSEETSMWAHRINEAGTTEKKVGLHVERWNMWDKFIYTFASGKIIVPEILPVKIDENQGEKETQFQKALEAVGARWSKKRVGNVLFDASFGSLNSTSDLDINVLSPDTEVLTAWVKFLKKWQDYNKGQTFTNYYDSNFYFEPCNKSMQSLRLALVNDGFEWTTQESYQEEFKVVKAYTEAYRSGGTYEGMYPNPTNMTQEEEIKYYEKCGTLAHTFVEAVDKGTHENIRSAYLKFASCKIEGIISIPALAICGVFGQHVMQQFMNKDKYDNEKALQIAVYEMLCNLRMHARLAGGELKFKSKYANRLINLIKKNNNICMANEEKKSVNLKKTNDATMQNIKLAMVFLLDYLDGAGQCHIHKYKNLQYKIDKVIGILENKISNNEELTVKKLLTSVELIKLRF